MLVYLVERYFIQSQNIGQFAYLVSLILMSVIFPPILTSVNPESVFQT